VNHVLRGSERFNMVPVPDDIPNGGATTVEGNVDEMRGIYKNWDPRCSSYPSISSPIILTLANG